MPRENSPAYKAGGTINVGRCVKISADNTVIQCTAAADAAIGIAKRSMRDAPGLTGSDNTIAALVNEAIEVFGPGEIAPALAGAAIAAGAKVSSNATGFVITAVATSNILGFALEAASGANVEIQVFVHPTGIMA